MNFYQSAIWRKINEDIYKKSIFEIEVDKKKYWWIMKEKSKGPLSFRWFQVLGIERSKITNFQLFLDNIKRDFKWFGNILFQFGFVDEITRWNTKEFNDNNFLEYLKRIVEEYIKKNISSYKLVPSFRENMMPATVIIDLNKSKDELYKNMIWSARNHYNKAKRKGLYFKTAEDWERKQFYDLWKKTSLKKGFNIIPESHFFELKEYLLSEKVGNLFLVKKWDEIVSGSICIFCCDTIIYLYGATNRSMWNIWWHQFLKLEMFLRWKDNWFSQVDLLGSCRGYDTDCSLYWVSKFKWSLWWDQIEYLGSWDLILDDKLYNLFKLQRKIRNFLSKIKN